MPKATCQKVGFIYLDPQALTLVDPVKGSFFSFEVPINTTPERLQQLWPPTWEPVSFEELGRLLKQGRIAEVIFRARHLEEQVLASGRPSDFILQQAALRVEANRLIDEEDGEGTDLWRAVWEAETATLNAMLKPKK